MEQLNSNHMWINALSCINPTDELAMAIGHWVLEKLNEGDAIPKPMTREELEDMSPEGRKALVELNRRTPQMYLRFNKS